MEVTGAALITGGAQGIGRATAERLSAEGWPVAVCDLDERAAKVATELEAAGGRAIGLAFDVADPDAATRAHDDAVAALGPVAVVVATRGSSTRSPGPTV
jgi:NAD(P)-dependent dehydrogenase (short-subunit alcohol dehydrogenase family)